MSSKREHVERFRFYMNQWHSLAKKAYCFNPCLSLFNSLVYIKLIPGSSPESGTRGVSLKPACPHCQ